MQIIFIKTFRFVEEQQLKICLEYSCFRVAAANRDSINAVST